jgi:SAM-dependent methyltransferase
MAIPLTLQTRINQLFDARRWNYLGRSAVGALRTDRRACPNCGAREFTPVASKLVVTALVRCAACRLLYRTPTDPPGHGDDFYQDAYESGWTTDLPSARELEELIGSGFLGTPKDFSEKIELLRALGVASGARLFDFGASWGYATWQFRAAGFDAVGYELGKPRARYAREMVNVPVHDDLDKIGDGFDVFFSSHVLEHIPQPRDVFALAKRVVRPGGLFVAFTPNGSVARMRSSPAAYHRAWGDVHPCLPDEEFYRQAFADRPKLLGSTPVPVETAREWDRQSDLTLNLTGSELLCAVVM